MRKRIRRSLLRTQVQDLLMEDILDGSLAPGESLPISELAARLDVSCTPLREALVALERVGLVRHSTRGGYHVRGLSATEAGHLFQIAGSLERLAVRSAPGFPGVVLERLATANAELRAAQGDPEAMLLWDGRFHAALTRQTQNRPLLELLENARTRLHRYRRFGYQYEVRSGTTEKRMSIDDHTAVIDLLAADRIPAAADHLEAHWERGSRTITRWLGREEV